MANENRCPKCKGPMAESYSTPGRFFCIATDKDCRIQELVRMNLEQAINFGELAKRFDALKVELKEAKAHEIEAWDAKSAQDDENWKFIENLKSERDAALAQVGEAVELFKDILPDWKDYIADGPYIQNRVKAFMEKANAC